MAGQELIGPARVIRDELAALDPALPPLLYWFDLTPRRASVKRMDDTVQGGHKALTMVGVICNSHAYQWRIERGVIRLWDLPGMLAGRDSE